MPTTDPAPGLKCCAKASDRLAVTTVLPTPPLPMAMMRFFDGCIVSPARKEDTPISPKTGRENSGMLAHKLAFHQWRPGKLENL